MPPGRPPGRPRKRGAATALRVRSAESNTGNMDSATSRTTRAASRGLDAIANSKLNSDKIPKRGGRPPSEGDKSTWSIGTQDFPASTRQSKRPERVSAYGNTDGTANASQDLPGDDAAPNGQYVTAAPLDPFLLKVQLKDLSIRSSDLYAHIRMPEGQPTPGWRQMLRYLEDSYNLVHKKFVNDEKQPFVTATDFVRIQSSADAESLEIARGSISCANLVSLLKTTFEIVDDSQEILPILEDLDGIFPAMFDLRTDKDLGQIGEALDMAFRIRCCCLTAKMETHGDQDPFVLAASLFCTTEAESNSPRNAKKMLLEGPYKPFPVADVNGNIVDFELPLESVEVIRSHTRHQTKDQLHKSLDESFPMDQLITDLENWAKSVFEQHQKGKTPESRQMPAKSVPNYQGSMSYGDDSSDSEPEPEPTVRRSQSGAPIDSVLNDIVIPESSKLSGVHYQATQQAAKRSGVDPRQLKGLDLQQAREALKYTSYKRPYVEDMEDEEEEEDEYEINEKPINGNRRIPKNTGSTGAPAPKRVRRSRQAARSPSLGNLSGHEDAEAGEMGQADIALLTQQAKAASRQAIARETKAPQKRTFWSEADTAALIRAIPEHQCSWARMAEIGLFSIPRTQQQVRDKARNLKVDFLKADALLPAGFDLVMLGKKERETVIKCLRNPERSVKDVDAEGRVINTIYIADDEPFA